jgi:hypothetical protein
MPRDPLRAVFLCLVVLVQLLMPTVVAQARAAQGEGCVGLSSVAPDAAKKQIPHAHGQECAHCRPQALVLAAPIAHPQITVAPAFVMSIAHGKGAETNAPPKPLPPATGPPVISIRV